MDEVIIVIYAGWCCEFRHGLVDCGIADAIAGLPYFVALRAGKGTRLLGASRTGVFGSINVADGAERREEGFVHCQGQLEVVGVLLLFGLLDSWY